MKHIVICAQCAKSFETPRNGAMYCSPACKNIAESGSAHHQWKGGKTVTAQGYLRVAKGAAYKGTAVTLLEHREIAERALGHTLPDSAVLHHWDEDKTNNTPSNLVICQDHAYHMLLHARKDRLADTGSLDLKRCRVCKVVKSLNCFTADRANWDGRMYVCKSCRAAKARAV